MKKSYQLYIVGALVVGYVVWKASKNGGTLSGTGMKLRLDPTMAATMLNSYFGVHPALGAIVEKSTSAIFNRVQSQYNGGAVI